MPNSTFSRCIYGDYVAGDVVDLPTALMKQNDFIEPCLDDLEVDDEVLMYSADGREYLGVIMASPSDVNEFRKLVAAKVTRRLYSMDLSVALHELTDGELDCILIFRGLNT